MKDTHLSNRSGNKWKRTFDPTKEPELTYRLVSPYNWRWAATLAFRMNVNRRYIAHELRLLRQTLKETHL